MPSAPEDPPTRSSRGGPSRRALWVAGAAIVLVAVVLAVPILAHAPQVQPSRASSLRLVPAVASSAARPASSTPLAALPSLLLDTAAQPQLICASNLSSCPAGAGEARVQLSATASGGPTASWPAVQVAFVIETTSYDGDLGTDRSDDLDKCAAASSTAPACEESNGIPFFVANAQTIANAIQQANPHSAVSFALVDYYDARGELWDDTDGPEYSVDIGQFVPAGGFGSLVDATFQQTVLGGGWYNWDQDLDNNFLDSSSIAALYGAIVGSQLNWSDHAHHVVVWMGSSAPRDPSYIENYCVSPSQWNLWNSGLPCDSQTCEPSYQFASGSSPNCEGWVRSQDGNPQDSIAALAHNAPACVDSIGGVCTVDTIDLWTTTTDPLSPGWPADSKYVKQGGGPGGPAVQANVAHVLLAGCDMATATGGTWNGPTFYTCPNGQAGDLQYVPFGSSIEKPNTNNPSLFQAFRSIGFGPVYGDLAARGSDAPMFQYVAIGSIVPATDPQWAAACSTPTGFTAHCQTKPTVRNANGVTYYGWNWSTVPSENALYLGDTWSASFYVTATGPPYTTVPVDACITVGCAAAGSGEVAGLYTKAYYVPPSNNTLINESFPVATVTVQVATTVATSPPQPPLPPPPIGGIPVLTPAPIPIATPIPVTAQLGIGTVSLQAAAAGFLGAGFMRVTVKNRPIAMSVAAKSGLSSPGSRFEGRSSSEPSVGRFV